MELIPADGKCIAANDGTIVWCDAVFSEWFSHRGVGAGAKLGQLFPGSRGLCRPGAVYEDTDKLGKRRYFAMECRPMYGMNGEKASDDVRIRKITLQKVLTDIPRMATQTKGPRELFEKVLWLLRDTTHYLAFAGYVARDGRVELVASKGWTEKLKSYISIQPIAPDSPSLAGRTAYHRQQIVMAMKDYGLMPAVKSAIHKLGGDYIVVTPLVDQEKLVGVLTVINDKALTPVDSEALQAICGQVAAALNLKLQEEAATAKADDAVLYANVIARTLQNDPKDKDAATLLRSLNDNVALENIPLKDAADYAISAARLAAEASHKKLDVKASGLEGVDVGPLFKYAIFEILKNSIGHSRSPSVDVDIRMSRERTGGGRLEISDNGPGIPDEFKSEVFRPVKASMKGGMGLYLVKKIANKYGGRVWIEDRVHGDHKKGTSVVITIPPKT
jgi:hypothetical protein